MGRNFDDHTCDQDGCDEYTKRVFMDNTPSEKAPHGYYIAVRGTSAGVRDYGYLHFCSVECLNKFDETHDLGGDT